MLHSWDADTLAARRDWFVANPVTAASPPA